MGRLLKACRDLRDGSAHRQGLAIALCGAALCVVPVFANDYWVRLLVFIFVNIALASSWNVIGGVTGYPSFGHSVFFGLGAYTAAIVMVRYQLSMSIAVVAGGLVAAAFSLLFLPVFRQKGFYFALSTLAALVAMETLVHTWEFTRGLKSWDMGWTVPSPLSLNASYILFLALLCGTVISVIYLLRSKTGLALYALQKDEVLASSIGIPTARYKATAFAVSAVWPGVIGAAFAPFMTYISTESMFDVTITMNMILISIFGGIGTVLGPIVGGIVLSVIDQIAWSNFLEYHRLIYGLLIVVIITYKPGGIVSWLWDLERLLNRGSQLPMPAETVPINAIDESGRQAMFSALYAQEGATALSNGVLLKVDGLSKTYGGIFALQSVSFELRRGEVLGLIGPNGAGKSTLFNLVSGIVPSSEGAIYLDGQSLLGMRPNEVCALGVARTFQSASLLSGMTVWENVHVASLFRPRGRQGGMSAEQCTRRALALCDLTRAARLPAEHLTVSEQKRIEIARALATNPLLIMTDEVLAGLNRAEGEDVLRILRQINREGISIIFVEHDVRAVVDLCHRVVVLAQGAKLSEGRPADVVRDPAVIKVYLGSRYASRH